MVVRHIKTPYACKRLHATSTWWVIVQFDSLREHPYFYAKPHPRADVLVLIDTGCGRYPADKDAKYADIRQYLEEYPVDQGRPLNPNFDAHGQKCARREYLVITTHVHYDHIGGNGTIAKAPGSKFVSSSFDVGFVKDPELRRKHALADEVGVDMPVYHIDKYAINEESLYWPLEADQNGVNLGLTVLQTPGHTPDSLTVYDREERQLFTGDTFYYRHCTLPGGIEFRQAIEFCQASSFGHFLSTLKRLKVFVRNEEDTELECVERPRKLRISCAHTTAAIPAMKLLDDVQEYVSRMIAGGSIPEHSKRIRGRDMILYEEAGDPDLSVLGPAWLLDGFRQNHHTRN